MCAVLQPHLLQPQLWLVGAGLLGVTSLFYYLATEFPKGDKPYNNIIIIIIITVFPKGYKPSIISNIITITVFSISNLLLV